MHFVYFAYEFSQIHLMDVINKLKFNIKVIK